MTIDLRLADLVASRLCHDLVGPAGAVAAGLELLEQPSDMDPEAMDLVRMSASQLNARLSFFRLAFGKAEAGSVDLQSIERVMAAYLGDGLTFHWHPPQEMPDNRMTRRSSRLLFLASMVAQSAILRVHDLSTQIAATPSGTALGVLAEGEGGEMDAAMRRVLDGSAEDDDFVPALLPGLLLYHCCQDGGCELQYDADKGATEIAILCP
ncbi:MAG: histidine phosphotransferase family protein [Rhodospirillales bacterium]